MALNHAHAPAKGRPVVPADATTLPAGLSGRLERSGMIIAGVGVALAGAAAATDLHRFAFSYLTAFVWMVTVALGALFFVLIHHLTRAGWSVAARRHAEWITGVLPFASILFLPIAALAPQIYDEWMRPEAAADPILHAKSAYLNPTFFFIRAVVYFAAWALISSWFAKNSRAQDGGKNADFTLKMQARSAPAILVLALTLTFAAFDWLMSLEPHWYSTIFGVYIFAGSMTSSLAALALLAIGLQKTGALRTVSSVEHRHDTGKLLFGFTIFWAYIAFSQYFLIWYANLPEETAFFRHRAVGSWEGVSLAIVFGHFVVPFFLMLSRHVKRSYLGLGIAAVLMLVMHYVDMYWVVMPALDTDGANPSWIDFATLLCPLGVALFVVARQVRKGPIYPTGDPRLLETLQVNNP
jgi:hypothetical protein